METLQSTNDPPNNPAIPKESKSAGHRDPCTPAFIAAVFVTAKKWGQTAINRQTEKGHLGKYTQWSHLQL